MGFQSSEVGYTSVKTGRGDHEVHKGHVLALGKKESEYFLYVMLYNVSCRERIRK
jgi:hypothetical protein